MFTVVPPVFSRKASTASFSSRSVRFGRLGRRDDTLVLHSKQSKKPLIDRYADRYADRFLDWFQDWVKRTLRSIKGLMLIPLTFGVAIVAALGFSALGNTAPSKKRTNPLLAISSTAAQTDPFHEDDAVKLTLQDGQSYDLSNHAQQFNNPWLNGNQVKISRTGNDYFIEDLKSEHGTYIRQASRWEKLEANRKVPLAPGTDLLIGGELYTFDVSPSGDEQFLDRPALTQSRLFAQGRSIPFHEKLFEGFKVAVEPDILFNPATGAPTKASKFSPVWAVSPLRSDEVAIAILSLEREFSKHPNWNELQKLNALVRCVQLRVPEGGPSGVLRRAVMTKILADYAGLEMELVKNKKRAWNRIRLTKPIDTPHLQLPKGTLLLVDTQSGRVCTMDQKNVRAYAYAQIASPAPVQVQGVGGTVTLAATSYNVEVKN
jgi:hypothetical protein